MYPFNKKKLRIKNVSFQKKELKMYPFNKKKLRNKNVSFQ